MSTFKKKLYTAILGSYRSAFYAAFKKCHNSMPAPLTQEPIDIIIPVIEKDLNILPLCIQGIRECVLNPIGNIYLVAPCTAPLVQAAQQHNAKFVDETKVLGYSPRDLNIITRSGKNRSGWIFQQLIKLSGNVGENRFFAVIDSDHILLRPHTFITEDKKCVFYQSKEYYYPYYENIKRLTGSFPFQHLSYIAHKMIFDKERLSSLRALLEQRNAALGDRWDKIIINSLDTDYDSSFSEFELYGHFVEADKKIRLPWKQKELLKCDSLPDYNSLKEQYAGPYWSVTFPDYLLHKD